jgi:hypothetical protein
MLWLVKNTEKHLLVIFHPSIILAPACKFINKRFFNTNFYTFHKFSQLLVIKTLDPYQDQDRYSA